MKKQVLQMLLVALFSVMGISYGWAETYDGTTVYFKGMREGACDINMHQSISYAGLNNSSWSLSETKLDGESTFQVGEFHGVNNVGTSSGGSRLMMCCYYEYPYTLPSYSKLVRNANFTINHASTRHYHGLGLYVFDTEEGATTTNLDATWDQSRTKPTGHLFSVAAMCVAGEDKTSSDKDLVFDNRNGANDATISIWFAFMHAVENGNPTTLSGQENGKWRMNQPTDTWYYYKHITFDGNGSTAGDMPKQAIENSGALTANLFIRIGYKFAGWNTKADGSGDTYTNGQTVTATATDKGEVTLYAQWEEMDDAQRKEQYDGSQIYLSGWKSGSCNKDYNITIPYNGLGNFSWGTSITETEGSTPFTFGQYHGIHNVGTSEGHARMMMCCYYVFPYMVPSYAKLVRRANFTITHSSDRHYHGLGLYLFDTKEGATTTYLDATWDQNQTKPAGCILSVAAMDNRQEEEVTSSDTALVFDNRSGANDSTLLNWFTFMHAVENGNPDPVLGQENGKWRMNQPTDTWYYYKHVTFDGNESTSGSMSKQIVENSAALPANTFVRTGYEFAGWNTKADGSGDAYTNGQTVTASATDKGEVTLYAQWSASPISDGTDMELTEAQNDVNTKLETWKNSGQEMDITIVRTIYKDGYYNTLCLPFDLTANQITETFGAYKKLQKFESATVQGATGDDREIVITTNDVSEIKAGKAYLISFDEGTDLTQLTFHGVVVSTIESDKEQGELVYQGILAPAQLPYEDENYLFVGEANKLFWPTNDGTFMKGFRAYFKVSTSAQSPYRRNMPAYFGEGHAAPTGINNTSVDIQEVRKLVEQGRVVIMSKGVKYDMKGCLLNK